MATVTVKNFIPAKYAENAQTTQYTAVNCKAIIDNFTVTNVTAGNVTFSLNKVVSGGAAAATNLIIDARSIAPHETYKCPEIVGKTLESGGFLSTLSGAATSLVIDASGREIT